MFTGKVKNLFPTKDDFKHMLPAVLRGTTPLVAGAASAPGAASGNVTLRNAVVRLA